MSVSDDQLPTGVTAFPLKRFSDHRGWLAEFYREEWNTAIKPQQWTLTESKKNTLRGMHVHLERIDYLVVFSGEMQLALKDLRNTSDTFGREASLRLVGDEPMVWIIPNGVAHGFYCPVDSMYLIGLSHNWKPEDDYAFRWDDPDFGIPVPDTNPVMSERDINAQSLHEVLAELEGKYE